MKLELLAVKINNRAVAQCPVMEKPLMCENTKEQRVKLQKTLDYLKEEFPEYRDCKIVKFKETIF